MGLSSLRTAIHLRMHYLVAPKNFPWFPYIDAQTNTDYLVTNTTRIELYVEMRINLIISIHDTEHKRSKQDDERNNSKITKK